MFVLESPTAAPLPQVGLTSYTAGQAPEVTVALEDLSLIDDESQMREMFDQYGALVFGISRKLVGSDAEDLVQQVFLAAWRSRHQFDPSKGSVGAWLSGIARFKAIDHLRASARRPSTPTEHIGELTRTVTETEQIVDKMVLANALAQLPPVRRQVIELGFFKGLTHGEISEQLDMPLGTVKSHSRRGLEALQRELEGSRVVV